MKSLKPFPLLMVVLVVVFPAYLAGQTNCDAGAGPLMPGQPTGISVQEIIQRLSAQESLFKEAQTHYIFTMNVEVQTLQGKTVDGEFRRVSEISFNQGKKIESVSFAPQSTLRRVSMSKQDFDDMDNRSPCVLTTQDLPQSDVLYLGQQKVDQLDSSVFDGRSPCGAQEGAVADLRAGAVGARPDHRADSTHGPRHVAICGLRPALRARATLLLIVLGGAMVGVAYGPSAAMAQV